LKLPTIPPPPNTAIVVPSPRSLHRSKKAEIHGFYADDVEEDAVGTVDLDFNRAGSPLIEVVFEPDIVSPADASLAVLYLRNLLRHVSVCDGKFELGSIRCDLNVSVWHGEKDEPIPDIERLGNRVEVKNLNSLKSIVGGGFVWVRLQCPTNVAYPLTPPPPNPSRDL